MNKSNIVVIVDDDAINRRLIEATFTVYFKDKKSVSFENGLEAWEYLQKNQADLVISDIEMSKMKGLELLKKIRETKTTDELPVILMTGNQKYETAAREAGANCFITKPFDLDDFMKIIRNFIS